MGGMYTLQPDESINDHAKESIAMMNELLKSLEITHTGVNCKCHSSLLRDVEPDSVRFVIQHVRDTIEMLDELTDELEDREDEIRQEYEEKVIQFFNRFMNADLTDETNYRAGELARLVHQLDNRVGELDQELEQERERSNQLEEKTRRLTTKFELAKKFLYQRREEVSRLKEELLQTQLVKDAQKKVIDKKEHQLKEEHERYMKLREAKEHSPAYWKRQFERIQTKSNQLEEQITILVRERDLAKKLAKKTIDENHILKNELTRSELELKALREVLDKKYDEIESLTQQLIDTSPNNPCNFCGNCKHFVTHPNDVGTCNNKHADPFIVDPDDASCSHFESNQVDRDKPDHEVCDNCDKECDDCGYYPF